MILNNFKKGQVSIEMLILIAVLILGAIILVVFLLGLFNKNIDSMSEVDATIQDGIIINNINDFLDVNENRIGDFVSQGTEVPLNQYYTLTLQVNGNGTANTSGYYLQGSDVTINAIADPNNIFLNWTDNSGNEVSSNSSYTFIMPSNNITYIANFQENIENCILELSVSPLNGGTVTGAGTYVCGSEVTITSSPRIVYSFLNWKDDNSGLEFSNSIAYTFTLDQNMFLTSNLEFRCPTGYILVPGNPTYNTEDFCVMKWEARYDSGSGHLNPTIICSNGTEDYSFVTTTAKSVPEGLPFHSANYCSAKQICENIGGSLITNDEWMTLSVNVINNPNNWANKTVGSTFSTGGGLFKGNVFSNDSIGCGNRSILSGTNPGLNCLVNNIYYTDRNKRMLILDNGEEIWDLAGNLSEVILLPGGATQSNNSPKKFRANGFQIIPWPNEVGKNFHFDYYPGGLVLNGFYLDRNNFGNFTFNVDEFFIPQNYNSKHGIGAAEFAIFPNASVSFTGRVMRGGHYFAGIGGGVLYYNSTNFSTSLSDTFRCVLK